MVVHACYLGMVGRVQKSCARRMHHCDCTIVDRIWFVWIYSARWRDPTTMTCDNGGGREAERLPGNKRFATKCHIWNRMGIGLGGRRTLYVRHDQRKERVLGPGCVRNAAGRAPSGQVQAA